MRAGGQGRLGDQYGGQMRVGVSRSGGQRRLAVGRLGVRTEGGQRRLGR